MSSYCLFKKEEIMKKIIIAIAGAIMSLMMFGAVINVNALGDDNITRSQINEVKLVDLIESEDSMDVGIVASQQAIDTVKAQISEPTTVTELVELFLQSDPDYAKRAFAKYGYTILND